mmetsp:Transcript_1822/g.4466  ORF Transcript_1822/g.4466 Transcript_1822/m.4466 type:complete len:244 (-) Transcript_1822:738-1469(-)
MLRSETALRLPATVGSEMSFLLSTSCSRNSRPTAPVAPSTATEICVDESARAACAARSARAQSAASTQMEIWRSEEPCAMVRMLMPAVAIALVKVAPVPGRKAMPSPTMATTEWSYSVVMEAMRPRSSSRSKTASSASVAVEASPSSTTMQMLDSAEACVCMRGEMPAPLSVLKRRSVRSGTAEVPVPSIVSSATLLMEVMPLMGEEEVEVSTSTELDLQSETEQARPWITVPARVGLKTSLT